MALFFVIQTHAHAAAQLHLSVNGLALSSPDDVPFIDHLFQWPPRLTWTLESNSSNAAQLPATDRSDVGLSTIGYDITLNGVQIGGCTTSMRCGGVMQHKLPAQLKSDTLHAVELAVVLNDGRVMRRSGAFRTALLNPAVDWGNASWIGGGTLLKRSLVDVAQPRSSSSTVTVKSAVAYASGVGCFSMRIDGKLVSTSYMDPGWHTLPTVRIPYRAYDVTDMLASSGGASSTLTVGLGMCKYR